MTALRKFVPRADADFSIDNQGNVFILYPWSEEADLWVADHLPSDAASWGGGFVVEHRYIADIAAGIINDGLTVG